MPRSSQATASFQLEVRRILGVRRLTCCKSRTSEDLWEIALQELKEKNGLSFDIGRTDRRFVVEEVLAEVLKKEQLCLQKRWKWRNRKGETIIVRDVFAKMVRWINKFKEIGDMVVQYDPAHAALPWAANSFRITGE